MPHLKLGRLPDRKPVKITIRVRPELNQVLEAYAALYRETYGEAEPIPELIPYMLESFLAADRGFAKARRTMARSDGVDGSSASPLVAPRQRRDTTESPSNAS